MAVAGWSDESGDGVATFRRKDLEGTPPMAAMLEDKVALITGAGRGIGREIALMMAAHGAKIVVNDAGVLLDGKNQTDGPANDVVSEIRAAGGDAVADYGSVSDSKSAHAMVARAADTFGRIDVVVNNAGILRDVIFNSLVADRG